MFGKQTSGQTDNSLHLDEQGVIHLTYKGAQTRETLRQLTEKLLKLMAEQREAGRQVKVVADMRRITRADSSARLESKWFLEEADWDALAVVGNRYLQPLIFFVLRDFKSGRKIVKYFSDDKRATDWLANPTPDTNFNRLKPHNRLKWAVLGLIVWISVSTVASWVQVRARIETEAKARFETSAIQLRESIDDRLRIYTEALYGFRGLFHSSDTVSELEYKDYFSSVQLNDNYPGINSVNFVTRVDDAHKAAFVREVQNDRSLRPKGDPDFAIIPDNDLPEHFIVTYVGVKGVGSGRGIDLAQDKDRSATLISARDSGNPTATGTIQLLNDQGQKQKAQGFLITIPVYRDEVPDTLEGRRAQHEGFVNAVFDYQKLFLQAFAHGIPDGMAIKVVDGVGRAVYNVGSAGSDYLESKHTLSVAGKELIFVVRAPKLFGVTRAEASLPFYVASLGVTLVILLAAVLWLQNRGRQRAVELASDMTEDIKQERNEAIATKNKDEAILSSIGDGVLVLDREGRVVLLNRAAETMIDVTMSSILGKHFKDSIMFVNEKTGEPADDFIHVAIAGQAAEMAAGTLIKRKDGSTLPVADSAAPVLDAEGKGMGAVVVFRDTTRERQLEKMKDELLSVASHELRTPMGAVRANVSMILSGDYGPVNKELVEPLTDIKASTVRLVELVNDLLSVARLEAGRMKFTLGEVEIHEVIRGEVANLAPLGKEKGVEVAFKGGEKTLVQADADKVKQVINNLVGNALKFTAKGSVIIAVDADKEKVEVTITDTGLGISSEDQKKLFGKFQQITSVQEGKPMGTGLGLYISREIIHKMGGDLWIRRSVPGQGSTFAFTLPRPGTPAAEESKQAVEREAGDHPDQR